MKNRTFYVVLFAAAGLATSCGYTAPYMSSGPAVSQEGVVISLAGERCYVNRTADPYPSVVDDDVLHVDLSLQVKNQSNRAAMLDLDGFRLTEGEGAQRAVMHARESGSLSLAPGESRLVALEFAYTTALDCHHDLALDAQDAIAIAGKPVELASIHFLPVH